MLGSLGYDTIRTPQGAVEREPGGSALHATAAAMMHRGSARHIDAVEVHSILGASDGSTILGMLEDLGADTRSVMNAPGATFAWSGAYEGAMDRAITLSTDLNVLEAYQPGPPVSGLEPSIVLLGNLHPVVQSTFLDHAPGAFALLDSMNLWIDITSAELAAVMQRCDALILNEDELRQFTGVDDLVTGASSLITAPGEPGPSMFMVKRGSSGSVLVHPEGNAWLGAVQGLDLVDPTGCGDAFAAGWCASIGDVRRGDVPDLERVVEAMTHATVTASFAIEGFGSRGLVATEQATYAERLNQFRAVDDVRIDRVARFD